jgi:hypothetical protein
MTVDGAAATDDVAAVEEVVTAFLAAFVSGPGSAERLDSLTDLFVPGAVVVRTCGDLQVTDVAGFVVPRRELLGSGRLEDFREWRLGGRTDVFGDVAQHWCEYAKSWRENGEPRSGHGWKSTQLVRTPAGWRISAVAWDDER